MNEVWDILIKLHLHNMLPALHHTSCWNALLKKAFKLAAASYISVKRRTYIPILVYIWYSIIFYNDFGPQQMGPLQNAELAVQCIVCLIW